MQPNPRCNASGLRMLPNELRLLDEDTEVEARCRTVAAGSPRWRVWAAKGDADIKQVN
jgi:hypothetical protein